VSAPVLMTISEPRATGPYASRTATCVVSFLEGTED